MSQVEPSPQQVQQRVESFIEQCRNRRLKVTPQRLAIFRALAATRTHPTAEDLYGSLRESLPMLSLDTVYRTLATLQEHRVIARVEVLDDRSRYDANMETHHHFVCVRCRRVIDVEWPELDGLERPDTRYAGTVFQVHAELRGLCRQCLEAEEG